MGLASLLDSAVGVNSANDNDVVVTMGGPDTAGNTPAIARENVAGCSQFTILCTAGTVKCEVWIGGDATNWVSATLAPLSNTDQATYLATLAAGNGAIFYGRVRGIRLKQSGATPSNARITGFPPNY